MWCCTAPYIHQQRLSNSHSYQCLNGINKWIVEIKQVKKKNNLSEKNKTFERMLKVRFLLVKALYLLWIHANSKLSCSSVWYQNWYSVFQACTGTKKKKNPSCQLLITSPFSGWSIKTHYRLCWNIYVYKMEYVEIPTKIGIWNLSL